MPQYQRALMLLCLAACLAAGQVFPVTAHSATPWALPAPDGLTTTPTAASLAETLRAVLVVGPIESNDSPDTLAQIESMELAAQELEANGVKVFRFYTPNNDWDAIRAAADGAHFFLYRGHGVAWGQLPDAEVGGFYLDGDGAISSQQVRDELHLAPNAIVMVYGCYAAGSDDLVAEPIDSTLAKKRVVQYSDPFFDIGASSYFSNWYGSAFEWYLHQIFAGQTLGEAFRSFSDFNPNTVEIMTYPDRPDLDLWLDKDGSPGHYYYDNAFAGLAGQTLEDLFEPAALMLDPSLIRMVTVPGAAPQSYEVTVESATGTPLEWTADFSTEPVDWAQLGHTNGQTGQALNLTLTPPAKPGVYETHVQVASADPSQPGGVQNMLIQIEVIDKANTVFLPALFKAGGAQ